SELLYSLFKNIENPLIDKIILFADSSVSSIPKFLSNKIEICYISGRLTYKKWMDCCIDSDIIHLLSNADIYFDETISLITKLKLDNSLGIISRKDLLKDGTLLNNSLSYNVKIG